MYKAQNGSSAREFSLKPTSLLFRKAKGTAELNPDYIAISTLKSNITGVVTWATTPSLNLYDAPTGGSVVTTGDLLYIRKSDFLGKSSVQISASLTDATYGLFSDSFTVILVEEGSDAIYVTLKNDNHSIPTDQNGGDPILTGSGTEIGV